MNPISNVRASHFQPCFLAIFCPTYAYAYIDPGSGGYLISSILATIGAFCALASAFVIHFFRNIVGKTIRNLWLKHRLLFLAGVLSLIAVTGAVIFYIFYEPAIAPFDASLSGAHIHDALRMYDGYSLYEGRLIDMQGHVVKKWKNIFLGSIKTMFLRTTEKKAKPRGCLNWSHFLWQKQKLKK